MNDIERLQNWYFSQCDGEWEHTYGIRIDSLDNPGWWMQIDLVGTSMKGKTFQEIAVGIDKNRHPNSEVWLNCRVENNKFHGAGDPTKLEEIIKIFLEWAEK